MFNDHDSEQTKQSQMNNNYLESVRQQFEYYKLLGEKTFDQVTDDALFWQYNLESNSISTIVQHISGNMLSRWTDFLESDGEKEWRNRESEFENRLSTRSEMLNVWIKGWNCLFNALDSISSKDLDRIIYIRNQGHTVTEAINRQLAHYPYHIGQMIYIGKMVNNDQWKSLSIPRGNSHIYNQNKFAQEKKVEHFTKEVTNQNKS